VGVALAAGLHAARLDGQPIAYNQADTLVPDLLICRSDLADRAAAALGGSPRIAPAGSI
jgi:3'(2'), 5'-bisphosphate nucleotidase